MAGSGPSKLRWPPVTVTPQPGSTAPHFWNQRMAEAYVGVRVRNTSAAVEERGIEARRRGRSQRVWQISRLFQN